MKKKKYLIVQVAGLAETSENWDCGKFQKIDSIFPALTCSVQATFRTAQLPAQHGMIANGIYLPQLRKPLFWEQSSNLVQGKRIWQQFRSQGNKVAMLFWQQSLGEDVDIIISPAPIHKHHGGMIMDCYSKPANLYKHLLAKLGKFKLQQYWGPLASWKVGEWITDATIEILQNENYAPELCLTYIPSLDYEMQRSHPTNSKNNANALQKCGQQLNKLYKAAQQAGYEIIIYGDYHIEPVNTPIFPNQILRKKGYLHCRKIKKMQYVDYYQSQAFCMVDHQIAHIYVDDKKNIAKLKLLLQNNNAIAQVLNKEEQKKITINHPNSGDLVLIANKGCWFSYPWWQDKKEAPEYASHVDIHNKPGYDPCELFFGWPPGSISNNPKRINGSHGRVGLQNQVIYSSTIKFARPINSILDLALATQELLNKNR